MKVGHPHTLYVIFVNPCENGVSLILADKISESVAGRSGQHILTCPLSSSNVMLAKISFIGVVGTGVEEESVAGIKHQI